MSKKCTQADNIFLREIYFIDRVFFLFVSYNFLFCLFICSTTSNKRKQMFLINLNSTQ